MVTVCLAYFDLMNNSEVVVSPTHLAYKTKGHISDMPLEEDL